MKHCLKSISIVDETSKTVERVKKGRKSSKHLLRKPLCNDELLKNYFELNTETNQMVKYQITKETDHIKHIVDLSNTANTSNATNQEQVQPPLPSPTETIQDFSNPMLSTLSTDEQQILLLHIYCALINNMN